MRLCACDKTIPGACGGRFTANTMATALEFLGIAPMGSGDVPALAPRKDDVAYEVGRLAVELFQQGLTPRQGGCSTAASSTRTP